MRGSSRRAFDHARAGVKQARRAARGQRVVASTSVRPAMFKLVSWGPDRFELHTIRGELFVSSGAHLARVERGALAPVSTQVLRASLVEGIAPAKRFARIVGRFPDDAWAEIMLDPSIGDASPSARPVVARWDPKRGLWAEDADLQRVMAFGRSAIAADEREGLRWADGRDEPLPSLPSEAGALDPRPGFGPFVAGAHGFYVSRRAASEPWQWWHFEPGSLEASELSLPLELGEHAAFAARGVEPLYACTSSRGAPFLARWTEGSWLLLPPPPRDHWPIAMAIAQDGSLWVVAREGTDTFGSSGGTLLRYREGFGWQPVRLPAPSAGALPDRIDVASGPAGELWLSVTWRGVTEPRATLHLVGS
jgi:hypothetical protein